MTLDVYRGRKTTIQQQQQISRPGIIFRQLQDGFPLPKQSRNNLFVIVLEEKRPFFS